MKTTIETKKDCDAFQEQFTATLEKQREAMKDVIKDLKVFADEFVKFANGYCKNVNL